MSPLKKKTSMPLKSKDIVLSDGDDNFSDHLMYRQPESAYLEIFFFLN